MITRISKTWSFDAAHRLPNHDGKCRQPHGHTYSVEVVVEGMPQPLDGRAEEGMVCDFSRLDAVWRQVEPLLDHRDLNVSVGARIERTTSERLAAFLFRHFHDAPELHGVRVCRVRVSETPKTYAEVRG